MNERSNLIHTDKYETSKLDIKKLNNDLHNIDSYKLTSDSKIF